MATNLAASTYTVYTTVFGVRYELSVTTRIGAAANVVSPEQFSGMVAHTICTWERVIEALVSGSQEIAPFKGHAWVSAEEKQAVTIGQDEPFVTVWNKAWGTGGLSATVQSWDNGYTALYCAYAMMQGLEKLAPHAAAFGIEKLEYAPFPNQVPKTPEPKQASPTKDINNVDEWLGDVPVRPAIQAPQSSTLNLRAFVRPAMVGSIAGTLKLQKGTKDKPTWEMAIIPDKPYHAMTPQFQDKDLIVYPITGKISYDADSKGFFLLIPVPHSLIRVRPREATQFEGKLIESDWQKLVKHLGLESHTLTQGQEFDVPATHIALKAGKISKDEHGNDIQWKNYQGLYALSS